MQSDFIVPRRVPDDDSFVAAMCVPSLLGMHKEAIANVLKNDPWTVQSWMEGRDLPALSERMDIMMTVYTHLSVHGIHFGGRRYSVSTGAELDA